MRILRSAGAVGIGVVLILLLGIALDFGATAHGVAAEAHPAPAPNAMAAGGPLPIVIGWQTDWLTIEAKKLHLLEKAGLKPTFIRFTAGAAMLAAAESKSVDVSTPGVVPYLSGIANGVPWAIIGIDAVGPKAQGFVSRKGSGIHDFADLRGKRIGYYHASGAQYALFTALEQNHIPLEQVKLFSLAPSARVAAMRAGQIDADEVWEPWMQKMIAEAHAYIFATDADLHIETSIAVYAARRDWLAHHPETARRFMAAIVMAGHAMLKDPRPAVDGFAANAGIPATWSKTILMEVPAPEPWRWLDPSYDQSMVKGGIMEHAVQKVATFLYQQHIIPEPLTGVGTLFDRSAITAALKASPVNRDAAK